MLLKYLHGGVGIDLSSISLGVLFWISPPNSSFFQGMTAQDYSSVLPSYTNSIPGYPGYYATSGLNTLGYTAYNTYNTAQMGNTYGGFGMAGGVSPISEFG